MESIKIQEETKSVPRNESSRPRFKLWVGLIIGLVLVVGTIVSVPRLFATPSGPVEKPSLPSVVVSAPLQRAVETRLQVLGQFSGVDQVELRAQVGGILTQIGFRDGDIVKKGDLLFVIDPEQYEIKLSQTTALLESANARAALAATELTRAETLKQTDAGSVENVEQRSAEVKSAQAAVKNAESQVRDAQFDLVRCHITAPFTGRMGTHLVSVGNLIQGSRAGGNPTTLLATLVSLDPVYLNFDMSESDYLGFAREHAKQQRPLAQQVDASLNDETTFTRRGTLDFIDNTLDRSSGTIHARATMPNPDLLMTPGGFARVRLAVSSPAPLLLVPDASVLADQSQHIVLTVGSDDLVTPKVVTVGDFRGGLRVIRSGLDPADRVIIEGMPTVRPGTKVAPTNGQIRFDDQQG